MGVGARSLPRRGRVVPIGPQVQRPRDTLLRGGAQKCVPRLTRWRWHPVSYTRNVSTTHCRGQATGHPQLLAQAWVCVLSLPPGPFFTAKEGTETPSRQGSPFLNTPRPQVPHPPGWLRLFLSQPCPLVEHLGVATQTWANLALGPFFSVHGVLAQGLPGAVLGTQESRKGNLSLTSPRGSCLLLQGPLAAWAPLHYNSHHPSSCGGQGWGLSGVSFIRH